MIPEEHIREWRPEHPWGNSAHVEQDLIIGRAIVSLYTDPFLAENLAFRGGTALHKLHLPYQARYSEDIDLVQVTPGPMRGIMDYLREKLSFLGDPSTARTALGQRLKYRFETEIPPVIPLRLKIEINCREHFCVLPHIFLPFSVKNSWYTGESHVRTYQLVELLGTKLRALYQRKKGRDLFDVDYTLRNMDVQPEQVLVCFCEYMKRTTGRIPTEREFLLNIDRKIEDEDFLNDTKPILRSSVSYQTSTAYARIKEYLLDGLDRIRARTYTGSG